MNIILFVILFMLVLLGIVLFFYKSKEEHYDKISFKETLDLAGLPIVTLRQGDIKLNFILDTGAFSSIIDSNILSTLQYTEIEGTAIGYGIDGKAHKMNKVGIILTYKDKKYSDVFRVLDMNKSFGSFKKDYGVTVHGLLSSSFFERYKYVLNYNELIAYSTI